MCCVVACLVARGISTCGGGVLELKVGLVVVDVDVVLWEGCIFCSNPLLLSMCICFVSLRKTTFVRSRVLGFKTTEMCEALLIPKVAVRTLI